MYDTAVQLAIISHHAPIPILISLESSKKTRGRLGQATYKSG
jgi:hypothetical protein